MELLEAEEETKACITVSRTSSGSSTAKYRSFPIPPRIGHSPTHVPFQFPGTDWHAKSPPSDEYDYSPRIIIIDESNKHSSVYALFQCIDNLVGISIFMTPYAAKMIGGQFVLLDIGLIGLIFSYTASLLEKCQRSLGLDSYPEVLIYDKSSSHQMYIASIVYAHAFLNLVTYYFIVRSSILTTSFSLLGDTNEFEENIVDGILVMIVIFIGVLILFAGNEWDNKTTRFIDLVKAVTKFALVMFSLLLMIVLIINRLISMYDGADDDNNNDIASSTTLSSSVQGISIICYGYLGHKMLPTIFSTTKETDFNQVMFVSFFIVTTLYIMISMLGIGLYGNDIKIIYLLNILPQYAWIHRFFIVNLSVFLVAKFLIELKCLRGSLVEALDLKRTLSMGRGRANSLDLDHQSVTKTETILSTCIQVVVPLSIAFIARSMNKSAFDQSKGDSTVVGYLVFINGGLFGIVLCWLLPICVYMEIFKLGNFIPYHEYVLMYLLMAIGISLVAAVILICSLDSLTVMF